MKKPATNMRQQINKRYTALFVPLLMLAAGPSSAADDDVVPITMTGDEIIDPKERISGGAVVGMNFLNNDSRIDPNAVFVYFTGEPSNNVIKAQLTTVDGRYYYDALPTELTSECLEGRWGRIKLINRGEHGKKGEPLSASFLNTHYNQNDQDNEIAILVTDGKGRAFPARWEKGRVGEEGAGEGKVVKKVRIRVNAEGADAYYIRLNDDNKGELIKCDEASENSLFKFDHNCDMSWDHVLYLAQNGEKEGEIQIIRKRGATYESPIRINVAIPESGPKSGSENCADRI